MIPEEEDDLWHTYNLISVGDSVRAVTVRYTIVPYTLFLVLFSFNYSLRVVNVEIISDN